MTRPNLSQIIAALQALETERIEALAEVIGRPQKVPQDTVPVVGPGYCMHCGRGSLSPSAQDWAQEVLKAREAREEAETLRERVKELEGRLEGAGTTSTPLAQPKVPEHGCKKCGRPEMDHSQWAMSHLYERGEVVLGYLTSVTMRANPQATHAEHLFTTTRDDGIVPDKAVCRIGVCMLTYGAAKAQGLTVTASALSGLFTPSQEERQEKANALTESIRQGIDNEECKCGHLRKRHVVEGSEPECRDCARDEYDHAFELAVRW